MSGSAAPTSSTLRIGLLLAAAMAPLQAWAHADPGAHSGLFQGLLHVVGGLDHLLVMVGVGLFAATLGGRARWVLPATFVTVMALTAIAAMSGLIGGNPAEHLIALSVIVVGVPIALALKPSLGTALAVIAVCAAIHGQAHGAELPAATQATGYLIGLMLSTALLHVGGAFAGIALNRIPVAGLTLTRTAGAAMTAAGLALAFA